MPPIVRFVNGRMLDSRTKSLIPADLWIDSSTGLILPPQASFYHDLAIPTHIVDLQGRILSAGLIDVQLNGAFGFDLSAVPGNGDMRKFDRGKRDMEHKLMETGVTAYLATMTSQTSSVYEKILPHLAPSSATSRQSQASGADCLGAHCEGPFMSGQRRGCHSPDVIASISNCTLSTLQSYYGSSNLQPGGAVKMITLAPELSGAMESIKALTRDGILVSVGHTEADYQTTVTSMKCGATMITHLFNAMNPVHHREPGPFGVITKPGYENAGIAAEERPYFGIIADGIHLHPASVRLAYATHPEGLILVTDAVQFAGLEDGIYDWLNGEKVKKSGLKITLDGTETIAGSAVTLIECLNNFRAWTGASTATALSAATSVPAAMMGISSAKGNLNPGADADLVIMSEHTNVKGQSELVVDQVWKSGIQSYDRSTKSESYEAARINLPPKL